MNPTNIYTKVCVVDYKKYMAMAVKAGAIYDSDKSMYTITSLTMDGKT